MVATAAAFFETAEQLDLLVEWSRAHGEPLRLVALTASADAAAEGRDLDYGVIEDFYDEEELLGQGRANFERVEELCAALDGEPPVSFSAQSHIYYLKLLLDTVVHRGMTLLRAFEALEPERVVFFAALPEPPGDELFFDRSSLSSAILPHIADARGVETVELAGRPADEHARARRTPIRRMLAELRRRLRAKIGAKSDAPPMRGLTLASVGLYPDRRVLDEWLSAGGTVVDLSLPTPTVSRRASSGWESVARNVFTVDGIDLFPVVETRLRHLTESVLPQGEALADAAERRLTGIRPVALIGSAPIELTSTAIYVAAERLGIPRIVHQHGGFTGYADFPILRFTDLQFADLFFCYGEGVAEYVASLGAAPPQAVPVGSSALDTLRARIGGRRPGGRRVLYAPTNLMGDLRYFSGHAYPDIWYSRLQRDVVSVCAAADVELLVKLPPGEHAHNPLPDWVAEHDFANVKIARLPAFSKALEEADLVILDSPATTLLQALLTDLPIVVLAEPRWLHLLPSSLELLSKRVELSTDREAFLRSIEQILGRDEWPATGRTDAEFLMRFGTHLNDGQSARRELNELSKLTRRP